MDFCGSYISPNNLQVLKKVEALRKKVVSVGKEHASLCAQVGIYLLNKNLIAVFFVLLSVFGD